MCFLKVDPRHWHGGIAHRKWNQQAMSHRKWIFLAAFPFTFLTLAWLRRPLRKQQLRRRWKCYSPRRYPAQVLWKRNLRITKIEEYSACQRSAENLNSTTLAIVIPWEVTGYTLPVTMLWTEYILESLEKQNIPPSATLHSSHVCPLQTCHFQGTNSLMDKLSECWQSDSLFERARVKATFRGQIFFC